MRRFTRAVLITALAGAPASAAASSGGGSSKPGPVGIPFSCSDARMLRAVYDGGGMRAKVRLLFDGGEAQELAAAPTPIGRRYTRDLGNGRTMVWSTDGVEAVIGEASAGAEQELARCHRAGRGEAQVGHDEPNRGDAH